MIHHIHRQRLTSDNEFDLFIFGDMQEGSGFCEEAWQEFEYQFKSSKNAKALGLGDYSDFLRPSMRARLLQPLAHDDSARAQLDNFVRKDQDRLLDKMQFLDNKLIGIHNGHHCWQFSDQSNSDQRLAAALHAPYLGWIASTRLVLEHGIAKHGYTFTIISMHGNSNARRVGPTTTWLESNFVNCWDADAFIMGHGCKSASFSPNEKQHIRRKGPPGVIQQIPRCLVVGGFAKGYTDGWNSSYVEKNGFSPQPLGWGIIHFKLVHRAAHAKSRGIRYGSNSLDIEAVNKYFLED